MWAAPLLGGARAVVLFNRHVSSDEKFDEHNMTLHWSMVGLPEDLEVRAGLSNCSQCFDGRLPPLAWQGWAGILLQSDCVGFVCRGANGKMCSALYI